ncbi:MAG: YggT family protein [Candidatus Paceibacterota bacterium]
MLFRTRNIINSVINIILTIVEGLLLFRLILKLLAADSSAIFTRWIYETSQPLLAPFEGMFPTVVESGIALEMSTLFAIMVYALLGYLLIAIVDTVYNASK